MKVFLQALNTSIANIDAIDEGKEPDQEERRDEAEVTFPGQFAGPIVTEEFFRLFDGTHSDLFGLEGGWGLTHV